MKKIFKILLLLIGLIIVLAAGLVGYRYMTCSPPPETLDEYIAAANKTGRADYEAYIGYLYYKGELGATQNYQAAKKWYGKAAAQGNDDAMCSIGWLYQNGLGVKQNHSKAIKLYKKDSEMAIKLFKRAAEKGNGKSMQNLGWIYNCGIGIEKDKTEAKKWYKRGTEVGNLDSFRALARIYYYEDDYKKACEYYRKGALLGYSPCMNALGAMNLWGRGTPINYTKAREWYHKAAALNNPLAMNWLGKVYEKGYGVPKDPKRAEEWYQRAIALNCAPAMDSLALLWADNGQTAKAEKQWKSALKLKGNSQIFTKDVAAKLKTLELKIAPR